MIDLSFLTEAEQEAILKVLNRDAELKKAEEERVKHLQDVVNDESEYKYKSGEWFYEAKSRRHRDKIHGAELVRASIRKRKKPTTLAELSELNKDSSKRRWVNSVNQDIFIPPELYGVMDVPDEAEEDVMVKKQEGNQSSKKVSFSSPQKEPDKLRNGTLSPPKPRLNPFNSEGLQDEPEYNNEEPSPNPENRVNGTGKPKSDIMSSLAKYGVKLPYPSPPKGTLNAPRAHDEENSQKTDMQVPVPKPRKNLKMNGQPIEHSNSTLKRDDSFNGMGKPRGILKRRSSSSSTDSESIRISQSVEPSKIVLPGSPILEAGQQNYFEEQDAISDNSPDRQKQVRFSEKIQQRPLSPSPELHSGREVGEYGILDPGLSVKDVDNGFVDLSDSEDSIQDQDLYPTDSLTKVLEQNAKLEKQGVSLEFERMEATPKDLNKMNNTLRPEASTDISVEPPSNISSGEEPLYSFVKKSPAASAPGQETDFDLDDPLMEPRFHGQRGKTQNIYLNEKPLEFGKSYSGGGKITYESGYPSKKHKESYRFSSEELMPERSMITETSRRAVEDKPVAINQEDKPAESVAFWRRPSTELTEGQKTSAHMLQDSPGVDKAEYTFGKSYSENLTSPKNAPAEDRKEAKYKYSFQNRFDAENKPVETSKTDGPLDKSFERKDLPKSTHFKVMSLKERMNEMPREQMSNPSQFQSLKHFWNVEEKNPHRETAVTSPDKILAHLPSRNKPTRTDLKQSSLEIPADEVMLPGTSDSLSEEEQTSQKVATWLAKTPTVYGVGQMDSDEGHPYSGGEIVEHVQKSTLPKKSDDELANSLQKLREEALESPKITGRSRTEEIRMMPQVNPYSMRLKQTTIAVSPTSQKSIETKAPTLDPKTSDIGFYKRVLQISNTQSPAKETVHVEPMSKPLEENKDKNVAPQKLASEFTIHFGNDTLEAAQKQASSQPNEQSVAEEEIEKSAVPKSHEQQDFSSALKRLEIEASKPPPLPDVEAEDQDKLLEEEIRQNTASPVKSSRINFVEENNDKNMAPEKSVGEFTISFGKFNYGTSDEAAQKRASSQHYEQSVAEEEIEKSAVPKSQDQEDFSSALKRLEFEASKPPPLPDVAAEDQDKLLEEEIRQNAASPVKSSRMNFVNFGSASEANDASMDHSVEFQMQHSYVSNKEPAIDLEETVDKSTVPSRKENEDFSIALRKLELEATEHQSDEKCVAINQNIEFEKPKRQVALQTNLTEAHSDINDSSSSDNGDDLEQPPKVAYGLRRNPDAFDGQGKLPMAEEPPIESTSVVSQESAADFHNRLLQLEEQAKIPEEPEDLLVDDAVKVSQFPNREVFISKKVYSSVESMHSSVDGESEKEVYSQSKPKDFSGLKSYDYSRNEELANPLSLKHSGSYPENGNILYKKPEVGSPEVSNSKPGMDESNPILRALKRSEAKTLNYKAVQEVSPTSTNPLNSSSPTEDTPDPTVNTFPQNAETLKRLSQSVPAFIQDENDGRDTDSASESSFQIGRHKKSPSSLTNLSGSSGMASMSSVSGSVMSIYSGDFGNIDIKGGIEFSIEYVEPLKEFLIYVYQCRDLAAAEVKKQRSDPYVKAYLLPEKAKMGKRKTAVKKKTLNPVYNEILRYKIPKPSLVAQTLNLSVWHHDALGRNSFLGEVNVNMGTWDWSNTQRKWYQLEPRTPVAGMGLENRGEMKLSMKYVPQSPAGQGTKPSVTGEVYIWIKDCVQLPMLRENKINSFVKCTVLPDTSRKSRQKTRTVDKTPSPIFNHTMVYDGFKEEDLREACVELTVWDHNRLSNHFLGGLRIGLGTGKSYGTAVDWMDSTHEESVMWEKMMASPNTWVDGMLPLRMFKMAKLTK